MSRADAWADYRLGGDCTVSAAAACGALLDKHAAMAFPPGALRPAEQRRLEMMGLMRRLTPEEERVRLRVLQREEMAGRRKLNGRPYGQIAAVARALVEGTERRSVRELMLVLRCSENSLLTALRFARQEAGLARVPVSRSVAMAQAMGQCRARPYRHGLFADVAKECGVPVKQLRYELNKAGYSRDVARTQGPASTWAGGKVA